MHLKDAITIINSMTRMTSDEIILAARRLNYYLYCVQGHSTPLHLFSLTHSLCSGFSLSQKMRVVEPMVMTLMIIMATLNIIVHTPMIKPSQKKVFF